MEEMKTGRIYALKSFQTDKIYIGSTIQKMYTGGSKHQGDYKIYLQDSLKISYISSFEIVKFADCYVEIIKEVICTHDQLLALENEEILKCANCVNMVNPRRRTPEEKLLYQNALYQKRKDIINEKFNCECGGKYTALHKKLHDKTKLHKDFLRYD